jgi:hypothetical protein
MVKAMTGPLPQIEAALSYLAPGGERPVTYAYPLARRSVVNRRG